VECFSVLCADRWRFRRWLLKAAAVLLRLPAGVAVLDVEDVPREPASCEAVPTTRVPTRFR